MKPFLSTTQNNRDHRKICVIDGKVGFTGGINLGDEYINRKVRFGHWKDTAVMLRGDAVQSLTTVSYTHLDVYKRQAYEYSEVSDMLELARERGEDPFIILLDNIEDPHLSLIHI